MPIVLVRIDDRLVHGQVVQGWIPQLDVDEVLVASASALKDEMRKTLMRLSLPDEIGLKVLAPHEAALYAKDNAGGGAKIMILAPGPAEVAEMLESGVVFESVNVGGMHYSVGKTQMGKAIFLSSQDIESLKSIAARGVRLEGRGVPADDMVDVLEMILRSH